MYPSFALDFNLRRYTEGKQSTAAEDAIKAGALHCFFFFFSTFIETQGASHGELNRPSQQQGPYMSIRICLPTNHCTETQGSTFPSH